MPVEAWNPSWEEGEDTDDYVVSPAAPSEPERDAESTDNPHLDEGEDF